MNNEGISMYKNKIITIPNILSFFRLCLIPVIVWLYCFEENYIWAVIVLTLSGLTDIIDGFIARHFGMVSDFGKIFDPVADKLTQVSVLLCLLTRFPNMMLPLIVLAMKEINAIITGLLIIQKKREVHSAEWHGKITTVLLYLMMAIHFIWSNIPETISNLMIVACAVMTLVSASLYTLHRAKILAAPEKKA